MTTFQLRYKLKQGSIDFCLFVTYTRLGSDWLEFQARNDIKMSDIASPKGLPLKLPIRWEIPNDVGTYYANNVLVQQTEHESIISFFQTFPPPILGTPEEVEEQLKHVDAIVARCIARIVVPAGKMAEFARVFQVSADGSHSESNDDAEDGEESL